MASAHANATYLRQHNLANVGEKCALRFAARAEPTAPAVALGSPPRRVAPALRRSATDRTALAPVWEAHRTAQEAAR